MYRIPSGKALLPLVIFVIVFLGVGLIRDNFYELPAPIVVLLGVITAFLIFYRNGINENVNHFVRGCGDFNILVMCLITLLAGSFSVMTSEIGATATIVQIANTYLSLKFLYAGVFVLASFLSFSSGTSTGTITALAPVLSGIVLLPNVDVGLMAGALLGGAMFGDNLSFTSDTTIAATQTLGCEMKDKFRVNVRIALPASVVTILVFVLLGIHRHGNVDTSLLLAESIAWVKILPYLVVIVSASAGVNVFVTLFLGILAVAGIGFYEDFYSLMSIAQSVYKGFTAMNEIFLVFLLMGGLSYMVEREGGFQFLIDKMGRFMTTRFRAKVGIALLISLVDAAIANNTIAIIVCSPIAKKISAQFGIRPAYTASLLDIFSCIVQGIIPYGIQVLLLIQLLGKGVSYWDMIGKSYYILFLFLGSVLYFAFVSKQRKGGSAPEPTLSAQ